MSKEMCFRQTVSSKKQSVFQNYFREEQSRPADAGIAARWRGHTPCVRRGAGQERKLRWKMVK